MIEFLQFLYEQNPSSGVVLERLVDAYALFYPALEKKIREKGRGFCNELINISTKYEEQEMWLKSVANNAIGVIEMESTNRGRAWKLFIETFKRYPENLDPFENLVSYSKNKKEYLEIIGLLNEYLEGTDIKLDENEIFINIIITFLEKVKNISLQQRIINIKLRYENTLLKNQNAWLESSSIYHGTMKDMVHDSFNTFRIKALGGEK